MKTRDFHYDLPESLIAQHPTADRTASRLLVLDRVSGELSDHRFADCIDYLRPGDCLIFNDTKVIPARMHGNKASGGKLEVLIERLVDSRHALAHIRCSKSPKPGSWIFVDDDRDADTSQYRLKVEARQGEFFVLSSKSSLAEVLQHCGHMPLPPYIERADDAFDQDRYQTVYADTPGAVAAPTAGLHFDEALLQAIADKGVKHGFVTLHVGAGTFQPVRSDDIQNHHMHSEYLEVSQSTVELCRETRANGGRIIAVGTTSVRCLETASLTGELDTYQGETDIFIYPGYEFRSVDALITNFHLPESTLIMLVSAFAGRQRTLDAYAHAIEHGYRFFSYGDAMLIS